MSERRRLSMASPISRSALLMTIARVRRARKAPTPSTTSTIRGRTGSTASPAPSENLADARLELAGAERLDDVVLGAEVERLHHILLAILYRQHQDRQAGGGRIRLERVDHLETVLPRQQDVQDQQSRLERHRLLKRRLAVRGLVNLVSSVDEKRAHEAPHGRVAVRDQNPDLLRHGRHPSLRAARKKPRLRTGTGRKTLSGCT